MNILKNELDSILKHVKDGYPKEACGILAGKNNKVINVYNMKNISDSPETCYFMDPKEQLAVFKEIRNSGLEMIAIYHSHTNTEAYPSKKDLELAFYPEVYYVIISLSDFDKPSVRAFKIIDNNIIEKNITVKE